MNYETYIKAGEHLKTLVELNKLTKEERISKRENVKHLLDGYIFYPITTWPSSIRETLEHDTITNKNTLKLPLHFVMEFPQTSLWNTTTLSFSIHPQK